MSTKDQKTSSIKTLNPATGKVEKSFDEMTATQVEGIFKKADKAYQSWKKTSFADRAKLLHEVATLMRDNKDELARLCSVEMGKVHREGVSEVELCADIFDYYAKNGEEFLADEPVESESGKAFISYEPIGVIFSVQPWNFPFYQMTRSIAPNIMAGNTVVMKQASNVPQCAAKLEEFFKKAGAPEGVYTNIFVSGSHATEIVANPAVKAVTFTGSDKAGASIAAKAGENVKKSMLELGGSDACIVLDDANLDEAVKLAAMGRLSNAGQVCVSPKRIIVPEKMFDQFVKKAKDIYEHIKIGDPQDLATQLGPLVSVEARDKVLKQVEDTVKAGAKLVYGGNKIDIEGAFMEPTILTDIKPGMVAYTDEIFGPVLCIFPARDEKDAIRIANDTRYGLGGSVIGKDTDRAVRVALQIETGMVYINTIMGIRPELIFGGTKMSGYGREHGIEGIREFVNHKLVKVS